MALALTREKRINAGNRMSRMLQEEEQDEFYATTYGGFEEVLTFFCYDGTHVINITGH